MTRPATPSLRTLGPMLLMGVVLIAGGSVAAGLTGAEAAKARAEHMKGLGAASKAINEQLKGGSPDIAVIKVNAAKIDDGAKALPTWFPPGSGQSADPKSKALPVVWTDKAGFQKKADALVRAAAMLTASAQAGDAAGAAANFKEVGAACKGCHETFKAKDKA